MKTIIYKQKTSLQWKHCQIHKFRAVVKVMTWIETYRTRRIINKEVFP